LFVPDYKFKRLRISKEEAEIIDRGGVDVSDWRKIKL
jgi:hypothetical protein